MYSNNLNQLFLLKYTATISYFSIQLFKMLNFTVVKLEGFAEIIFTFVSIEARSRMLWASLRWCSEGMVAGRNAFNKYSIIFSLFCSEMSCENQLIIFMSSTVIKICENSKLNPCNLKTDVSSKTRLHFF